MRHRAPRTVEGQGHLLELPETHLGIDARPSGPQRVSHRVWGRRLKRHLRHQKKPTTAGLQAASKLGAWRPMGVRKGRAQWGAHELVAMGIERRRGDGRREGLRR